jgi:hypothetical protein
MQSNGRVVVLSHTHHIILGIGIVSPSLDGFQLGAGRPRPTPGFLRNPFRNRCAREN